MAPDGTGIEWADATVNAIRARNRATGKVGWFLRALQSGVHQLLGSETFNVNRFGNGIAYKAQNAALVDIFLDDAMLTQPLRWQQTAPHFLELDERYIFGEFVTDEMIDKHLAVMAR